jgi:hypothetical protein
MSALAARVSVIAALVLGASVGLSAPAGATLGSGTHTTITTPASDVMFHWQGPPATNAMTVSGTASPDVTLVDIDCILRNGSTVVRHFATDVPVTGGHFSTVATIADATAQCRLRAVPTEVDPATAYVGAFAGPMFRMYNVTPSKDGSKIISYFATSESRDGFAQATDAGLYGVVILATVDPVDADTLGSAGADTAFTLPYGNDVPNPTKTSVTVDGHNAYSPVAVSTYLRAILALTLTQPALTLTSSRASNGDLTITETEPLMRCSVSDVYPPTSTSCPSLVNTGIQFHRVTQFVRGVHQVRVRDSYRSTNGQAHTVRPAYQIAVSSMPYGEPGFQFPGHGPAFQHTTLDETVTGLGTRAGTLLVRHDRFAVDGDGSADVLGFSWSRPPQKLQFGHNLATRLSMPYVLTVPAGATRYLGFAESEHLTVSDTVNLANIAVTEMVNVPSISSPAPGATVHGKSTTVKGSVSLGANGLPTSVTVNGHAAALTTVSATKRTFAVTFSETLGKHTITVVAKDSAGNTRSRSIKITNV